MDHADAIHKGEFTTQAELAAADRTDLEKLGIPKGAAGLIIAAAAGKGDSWIAFIFHKFGYGCHLESWYHADAS